MFYTVKKRTIIYGFAFLLAISLVVLCGAVKEASEDAALPATGEAPISGKTILIDAGHGGFDSGASVGDLLEKDLNLSVALKLRVFLKEQGATVVMTRESDISTADESRANGTSAKVSDLKRRREMIEECKADAFVSIHMNKFPQQQYRGAQVFYAENSDESRMLGEYIQNSLLKTMNDGNMRAAKKSNGSIYILKNAAVPSVIVECGFLSNSEESKLLQNNDYQHKIAFAICMGIFDFFS